MVSLGQELWILKLTCLSRKKRKKRKGFVYEKLWSFSFSLVCSAPKREVLVVNLTRFHPRNVKEKKIKMLCLGKYHLGIKGAMSRPAHVQDFYLLCWFSQLSAILDLGNQADLWQQTSVYSTVLSDFLFVYLSIFLVQFYCSYRREIMISDEATESVAVRFLRCW